MAAAERYDGGAPMPESEAPARARQPPADPPQPVSVRPASAPSAAAPAPEGAAAPEAPTDASATPDTEPPSAAEPPTSLPAENAPSPSTPKESFFSNAVSKMKDDLASVGKITGFNYLADTLQTSTEDAIRFGAEAVDRLQASTERALRFGAEPSHTPLHAGEFPADGDFGGQLVKQALRGEGKLFDYLDKSPGKRQFSVLGEQKEEYAWNERRIQQYIDSWKLLESLRDKLGRPLTLAEQAKLGREMDYDTKRWNLAMYTSPTIGELDKVSQAKLGKIYQMRHVANPRTGKYEKAIFVDRLGNKEDASHIDTALESVATGGGTTLGITRASLFTAGGDVAQAGDEMRRAKIAPTNDVGVRKIYGDNLSPADENGDKDGINIANYGESNLPVSQRLETYFNKKNPDGFSVENRNTIYARNIGLLKPNGELSAEGAAAFREEVQAAMTVFDPFSAITAAWNKPTEANALTALHSLKLDLVPAAAKQLFNMADYSITSRLEPGATPHELPELIDRDRSADYREGTVMANRFLDRVIEGICRERARKP